MSRAPNTHGREHKQGKGTVGARGVRRVSQSPLDNRPVRAGGRLRVRRDCNLQHQSRPLLPMYVSLFLVMVGSGVSSLSPTVEGHLTGHVRLNEKRTRSA